MRRPETVSVVEVGCLLPPARVFYRVCKGSLSRVGGQMVVVTYRRDEQAFICRLGTHTWQTAVPKVHRLWLWLPLLL